MSKKLFQALSNNNDVRSLANAMRRRRFAFFGRMLSGLLAKESIEKLRILDLGGTRRFWQQMDFDPSMLTEICILNNAPSEINQDSQSSTITNVSFSFVQGDACDLSQFENDSFDIVFSNSVIEHVGSRERQQAMMSEARRVGKRYFIQTPNYYFPLEPHFLFVGFQFLPFSVRVWLVRHFSLGWFPKARTVEEAESIVSSCNLLKKRELKGFAPKAQIYSERFFGLVKSFIVYEGWQN